VPLSTATRGPGITTIIVPVAIKGDVAMEFNEYFSLLLASPGGARIADGTGIGSISNDENSYGASGFKHAERGNNSP